jgi:hypothetical protein
MAVYYFHIDDGAETSRDKFGVELPDLRAARVEGTVLAGELLRDRPDEFWGVRSWTMTVEDRNGTFLFSIHIAADAAAATVHQLRG